MAGNENGSNARGSTLLEPPRPLSDSLTIGVLLKHGRAPYLNDRQGAPSYFITVGTPQGERTVWGRGLERAIVKSRTQPQIGEEIGVRQNSIEPGQATVRIRDDRGREIDMRRFDQPRPRWIVERRGFFNERAAMAKALRDPKVPRHQAVRNHPELEDAYVVLDGAIKVATASMVRPEASRRLIAFVRETLAYTIERGESLKMSRTTVPTERKPSSAAQTPPDLEPTR